MARGGKIYLLITGVSAILQLISKSGVCVSLTHFIYLHADRMDRILVKIFLNLPRCFINGVQHCRKKCLIVSICRTAICEPPHKRYPQDKKKNPVETGFVNQN